jgi:hypothetical protein
VRAVVTTRDTAEQPVAFGQFARTPWTLHLWPPPLVPTGVKQRLCHHVRPPKSCDQAVGGHNLSGLQNLRRISCDKDRVHFWTVGLISCQELDSPPRRGGRASRPPTQIRLIPLSPLATRRAYRCAALRLARTGQPYHQQQAWIGTGFAFLPCGRSHAIEAAIALRRSTDCGAVR